MTETWRFGSEAGFDVALALFATISMLLGTAIYTLSKRAGVGRSISLAVGAGSGLLIMAAIYLSSFDGFQTLHVEGPQLRIAGLHDVGVENLTADDIVRVEAQPAFKLQWRLVIELRDGSRRQSKPAGRMLVKQAAERLHQVVGQGPRQSR